MRTQLRAFRDFWREQLGHFVWITAAAFLVVLVLGYAAGRLFPQVCDALVQGFSAMIDSSGVADETGELNVLRLFGHNFRAVVVTMLYGLIPFLYLPALSLGVNALVLGVMGAYFSNGGLPLTLYLAGILPHGIFELPALIVGMACGICLCRSIDRYIRQNEKGVMKPLFLNLLRTVCLLLPLLAVAAVVEARVTPLVMGLFM